MENNHGTEVKEMKTEQETKSAGEQKQRRRLNPIAKWTLIGLCAVTAVGGVTYLIVKGHKVPEQAVAKIAETTAEVAAAV